MQSLWLNGIFSFDILTEIPSHELNLHLRIELFLFSLFSRSQIGIT